LGESNTGVQWDKIGETLGTLSAVTKMFGKPDAHDLAVLIDKLNLDMSRKHRELLQQ